MAADPETGLRLPFVLLSFLRKFKSEIERFDLCSFGVMFVLWIDSQKVGSNLHPTLSVHSSFEIQEIKWVAFKESQIAMALTG